MVAIFNPLAIVFWLIPVPVIIAPTIVVMVTMLITAAVGGMILILILPVPLFLLTVHLNLSLVLLLNFKQLLLLDEHLPLVVGVILIIVCTGC